MLLETCAELAPDEADRKLGTILFERYIRIFRGDITMEKIKRADPEWTRICKSVGISRRTRIVLPDEPPVGTVFVKDPEPLASFNDGMLVMPCETAEKILVLGFMP